MLSEEEKKAINRIYVVTHCINGEHTEYIDIDNIANEENDLDNCEGFCKAIDIVLNLIEKQNIKIASKDKEIKLLKEFHNKHIKIIDKMADALDIAQDRYEYMGKERVIEYFTNKVEEENK